MHNKPRMMRLLLIAALLLAALSACSSSGVKGEAPFVQVLAWQLQDTTLQVSLRLRNVNDEQLDVEGLAFTVWLDGTELANYQGRHDTVVPATGAETLELSLAPSATGLELLAGLQAGDPPNLPYSIDGTVRSGSLGELGFSRAGRLYPVPGRPGQFR
jgi:LEA14-like dessication related protein